MLKKINFFLFHLMISLLVSFFVLGWIYWIWYPFPLASAVGVIHLFFMMLVIDVIIGPILGFIVYKDGKKTLKFDLSIIILIQITALIYGVFSIEQGRPVWLVYNVDRFELIKKNEVIEDHIKEALPQYQQTSWLKPQLVAVEFAKDANIRSNDMFAEALSGISIAQKPERYVPLEKVKLQIQQRAQVLSLLNEFNAKEDINTIIKKYPQADSWVPLKANAVDMVVLINKEKGEVVKIVDLRPWK